MTHNVLFADKPRYRTRGDSANSTIVIRASTIITRRHVVADDERGTFWGLSPVRCAAAHGACGRAMGRRDVLKYFAADGGDG